MKITKDCIQAEITFDTVAEIRSDHSLWLLHPLTSEMCCKLRKRQREGRRPYWDETEFGPQPKFQKLMENVSMISAAAMTLAVVKTDGTLLVWDRMQSGCEDRPDFVKIADGIKTAETGDGVSPGNKQDRDAFILEKTGTKQLLWTTGETYGTCETGICRSRSLRSPDRRWKPLDVGKK